MKTRRKRIYVKFVDPRICYGRGRGFEAYARFCHEAYLNALKGKYVCTCESGVVYDARTMIFLA